MYSCKTTATKCTKKVYCTCKVAFLLIRPIVFHRSLTLSSPLSITQFYILFEQTINIIESFAFSPGDWEIRKRICRTILVNSGLLFANYACACKKPLFLRTVFQILFRISHSNGKKEIQKQISRCLNPFSDFAFDYKSEIQTSQSNAPFVSQNNETTAILVYQTIPVGDEHFCHLKLSFVPINLHS